MSSNLIIIRADGSSAVEPFPPVYDHDRDRERMREIVDGDIEFVWVTFNDKRTCMIVNETGAVQNPPLPINQVATHIYHTYPARRDGISMEEARKRFPPVRGDVAILDNVKVE